MIKYNKVYFALTILLFIAEVIIGVYAHDSIIRPYVGDFLVVILIYCFLKSFIQLPVKTVGLAVLLFAYTVEFSQYFKLVARLGWKHAVLANILLGNSFSWIDLLMYTLGIALVVIVEKGLHLYRKRDSNIVCRRGV